MLKKLMALTLTCLGTLAICFCLELTTVTFLPEKLVSPTPQSRVLAAEIPTPTPFPTFTPTPTPTATPTPTPLPTATPTPSPTPIVVSSGELENWFTRYSSEYGVDGQLLRRIAACESGYRSNASNGDYKGMFQFATATWQGTRAQMGQDPNPDLRMNPEEAIKTAAFKMKSAGGSPWPNCLQ